MIVIVKLVWDSWNVEHIARHDVIPEEVEEVCHGKYIVRETYDKRLLLIGPTLSERILAIVLGTTKRRGAIIRLQHGLPVRRRSAFMKMNTSRSIR